MCTRMSVHKKCDEPRQGLYLVSSREECRGGSIKGTYCSHLNCLSCLPFFYKTYSFCVITYTIKIISKKNQQSKESRVITLPCFPTAFRILSLSTTWARSTSQSLTPDTRSSQTELPPALSPLGPHIWPPCPPLCSALLTPSELNSTLKGLPRLCRAGRAPCRSSSGRHSTASITTLFPNEGSYPWGQGDKSRACHAHLQFPSTAAGTQWVPGRWNWTD